MTDLDAQIRAKLADYGEDPCGYATCIVIGFNEMRAALLAVLDGHPPEPRPGRIGERGDGEGFVCAGETHACGMVNEYTTYPCETVLKIAKGLGIEVPRG